MSTSQSDDAPGAHHHRARLELVVVDGEDGGERAGHRVEHRRPGGILEDEAGEQRDGEPHQQGEATPVEQHHHQRQGGEGDGEVVDPRLVERRPRHGAGETGRQQEAELGTEQGGEQQLQGLGEHRPPPRRHHPLPAHPQPEDQAHGGEQQRRPQQRQDA
jgi:hypothetical protein